MRTPHPDVLYYLRFIIDSDIYYLFILGSVMAIGRETIRLDRSSVGVSCGRTLSFSRVSGGPPLIFRNQQIALGLASRDVTQTFLAFDLEVVPEVCIILRVAACVRLRKIDTLWKNSFVRACWLFWETRVLRNICRETHLQVSHVKPA